MWNLARAIGLLFVLFVCVGCDSVMMQHPIGEVVDDSEGRKLDGVWKTDNGDRSNSGHLIFSGSQR